MRLFVKFFLLLLVYQTCSANKDILSLEEKNYIQNHKFSVCARIDHYPSVDVKESKLHNSYEIVGIGGEIAKMLYGRLDLKYSVAAASSQEDLYFKIKSNFCDMVVTLKHNQTKFENLKTTEPMFITDLVSIGNIESFFIDDYTSFDGHIFYVKEELHKSMVHKYYPKLQVQVVTDIDQVMKLVESDSKKHFINIGLATEYLIQKYGFNKFKTNGRFTKVELKGSIGVNVQHPLLLSALNKIIVQTPKKEFDDIVNIFNINEYKPVKDYTYLVYVVVIFLIIMLFLFYRITTIKKFNQQILKEQVKLAVATQSGNIGVWELEFSTNNLVWNEQMYELYEVDPKTSNHKYSLWSDALIDEDKQDAIQKVQEAIKNQTKFDTVFRIHTPSGIKHIKAYGVVVKDNLDQPISMIGINIDLTREKQLLEDTVCKNNQLQVQHHELEKSKIELRASTIELEYLNASLETKINEVVLENLKQASIIQEQSKLAAMGEMVGAIAHNWRQPLNEIGIRIQKLKLDFNKKLVDENYILNFIEKNVQTIDFMSRTIDDFRNFFRTDKTESIFTLDQAIRETFSLINGQLKSFFIEVIYDETNAKAVQLQGPKREFEQALLNLLNNAKDQLVESNTQNPWIKVEVFDNKLIIEDNGGGIRPVQNITRVFEPYFTTKEQGKGTGIGLYMSKMILEETYKAKLLVKNSQFGAMFTIDLSSSNILLTNQEPNKTQGIENGK